MKKNTIIVDYGKDPYKITQNILNHIDFESLISNKESQIALKPNLVVAKTPDSGATTHVEIIIALIEHLQKLGYHNIKIIESSWVGDSTKRSFKINGYYEISRKYNVALLDVKDDSYAKKTSNGITMQISNEILKTDFLINLPVLKGHCQTNMTCALKNMKGCLSDRSKRLFHSLGLFKPIAVLNSIKCADLVIVDSICGDLDFEEGGNPVQTDRIFAGRDSVLIDSYGASLLGFDINEVEYIPLAEQYGVGSTNLKQAEIEYLNKPLNTDRPQPTGQVGRLAKYTKPNKACSACYGNLIHALKRINEMGKISQIKKICIGQGYRGITDINEIGVGNCAKLLGKSLPGCPPTATEMIDFLLKNK